MAEASSHSNQCAVTGFGQDFNLREVHFCMEDMCKLVNRMQMHAALGLTKIPRIDQVIFRALNLTVALQICGPHYS